LNDLRRLAEGLVEGQRIGHATKCSATPLGGVRITHQQKSVGGTGIVFHEPFGRFGLCERHKGDHRNECSCVARRPRRIMHPAQHEPRPVRVARRSRRRSTDARPERRSPRRDLGHDIAGVHQVDAEIAADVGCHALDVVGKEHALAEGRGHHGPSRRGEGDHQGSCGYWSMASAALAKAGRRRPPSGARGRRTPVTAPPSRPRNPLQWRGCRAWVKSLLFMLRAGLPAHQLYGQGVRAVGTEAGVDDVLGSTAGRSIILARLARRTSPMVVLV